MLGVIRVDFYRNYAIIANYYLAGRRKMPFQIPLPAPSGPPIVSCSRGMIGGFNALIYGILLPIGRAALGVKSKFPRFQGKTGSHRSAAARQFLTLPTRRIEIAGGEPVFERRLERRPFAVEDREPTGVAVAPLGHGRLAE